MYDQYDGLGLDLSWEDPAPVNNLTYSDPAEEALMAQPIPNNALPNIMTNNTAMPMSSSDAFGNIVGTGVEKLLSGGLLGKAMEAITGKSIATGSPNAPVVDIGTKASAADIAATKKIKEDAAKKRARAKAKREKATTGGKSSGIVGSGTGSVIRSSNGSAIRFGK